MFVPKEYAAKTPGGRDVLLRFPPEEYAARLAATRKRMREEGLDALLVFAQESHYWLTGFDTAGFVFFQAGVITADESSTVILTRTPDKRQAEVASLYDEVRIWLNAEDANPALDLRAILEEKGLKGKKVGIEYASYGLTAFNGRTVDTALEGFCETADGSWIIRGLRLIKSSAELEHVRIAGKLADAAVSATIERVKPGIPDSALIGAAFDAMVTRGGDTPSGGPMVNAGAAALFGRDSGIAHYIEEQDQVLVELAASHCRYHVCIESTLTVGPVDPRQERQMGVARDAIEEIKANALPGRELGTLDDIHRRVLDKGGFAKARYAACGYALGCTFKPTWMDVPPMIYSGNPLVMQPGMVFFVHIMIPDTDTGLVAGIGQTFVIRETGEPEVFSDLPVELFRR